MKIPKIKIILLFLISLYLIINVLGWFFNFVDKYQMQDISKNETLLVVSAHQDDETVIAGGMIIKTIAKGGQVFVVYTVDGVTRPNNLDQEKVSKMIDNRESEARLTLSSVGVKLENVYFLGYENEKELREKNNVKKLIVNLSTIIKKINPDTIIVSAFEGGHCDHDISNYATFKATQEIGFSKAKLLEAPEYNRYYISESLLKRLNKFLFVKYDTPPRFIPEKKSDILLSMTLKEREAKRKMLTFFKSQSSTELIGRFDYPDKLRTIINYNYSNGPFDPDLVWRHKLCLLTRNSEDKCPSFYCGMTYSDYIDLYTGLESNIK